MKRISLLILLGLSLTSCSSYMATTRVGKGMVSVVKNDFLFGGLFRGPKVYICRPTPQGLTNCSTMENP